MITRTHGMQDLNYSKETFNDMYEAINKFLDAVDRNNNPFDQYISIGKDSNIVNWLRKSVQKAEGKE